jgi:hypothetical protein
MAKFGRYEFGKDKPAEEYCGDFMELEKSPTWTKRRAPIAKMFPRIKRLSRTTSHLLLEREENVSSD